MCLSYYMIHLLVRCLKAFVQEDRVTIQKDKIELASPWP